MAGATRGVWRWRTASGGRTGWWINCSVSPGSTTVPRPVLLAERKDIDLGVHIETPATLHASEDEVRVLFANLVDNALRYTPSGGQVDVRLLNRNGACVVTVRDTGCGLPPGSEGRLFDRFFRAAPPEVEGTGLGLAIARRIAERNDLGLTVENRRDGQGTLATVRLPA